MHDVLAHSLSGLVLNLESARLLAERGGADPQVGDAIDRAHRLAKTGLEEARRAIGMLREDALPGPERLAELAAEFEGDTGVACTVAVIGDARDLGSDGRLTLYRVAQEALTNIRKHACPDRVEVRLAYEPSGTRLDHRGLRRCRRPPRRPGTGPATGSPACGSEPNCSAARSPPGPPASGFRVELWVPGMTAAIRVLVADDQRVVREGLGTLLGSARRGRGGRHRRRRRRGSRTRRRTPPRRRPDGPAHAPLRRRRSHPPSARARPQHQGPRAHHLRRRPLRHRRPARRGPRLPHQRRRRRGDPRALEQVTQRPGRHRPGRPAPPPRRHHQPHRPYAPSPHRSFPTGSPPGKPKCSR